MATFVINPTNLDFNLPDDLIAQEPLVKRDEARLMVIDKTNGSILHRQFRDLPAYLRSGDVLVINSAKVSRRKLTGRKESGGKVEIICLEESGSSTQWRALIRPQLKPGARIILDSGDVITFQKQLEGGENIVSFESNSAERIMQQSARLPLPPYIKRSNEIQKMKEDEINYQTVYASREGSIAAPTAGLHFTDELLTRLKNQGISIVEILLNVGWGTFKPISSDLARHEMLGETFELSESALTTLYEAKQKHQRIIAVGTTATRTLESLPDELLDAPRSGETKLFIKPGFTYRWLSGLITNFHVPRSTPISLTAAFLGLSSLEKAYAQAIEERYRFYSYGDAMLII